MSYAGSGTTLRGGALALAAAVVVGVVLGAAPAAYATTVPVDYQCQTPIGNKGAVSPIDIKAARSGSDYKLTMSFEKGVSSSPIELGKGAMNPSAVIKVGGADSGTVNVSGPPNDAPIPANTPIKINDLTGTYTPHATGKVTFTAGTLTIKALGTTTTCNASNNPGPSLTLDVTAASGSSGSASASASGSSSGSASASGSGSGGQLPQTGPDDSTVALGTFGGTVLLLGAGGVLWLNRRNQPR
jgi:LPXTG-motif cell wall-anchored protein